VREHRTAGLVVTAGGTAAHRELIVSLTVRHRLPTVYPFRYYVPGGGVLPDELGASRYAVR
jgi:putative ABC transport system substrate-binding protein